MTEELTKPKRKHPHRKDYTTEERERGMLALAYRNGNAQAAGRDTGIPATTLRDWPRQTPEVYAKIRSTVAREVRAMAAERHMAALEEAFDIEAEANALLREKLHSMDARDLSSTARNGAVSSGIHSENALKLNGDATVVVEHRSVVEIRRSLKSKGFDLEAEAEEVK